VAQSDEAMNDNSRSNGNDWKTNTLVIGGVIGALLGVIAGRLFADADEAARERDRQREPKGVQFSLPMLLPFALTIISLLRQISNLAKYDQK
jgi:hypothetical protein